VFSVDLSTFAFIQHAGSRDELVGCSRRAIQLRQAIKDAKNFLIPKILTPRVRIALRTRTNVQLSKTENRLYTSSRKLR